MHLRSRSVSVLLLSCGTRCRPRKALKKRHWTWTPSSTVKFYMRQKSVCPPLCSDKSQGRICGSEGTLEQPAWTGEQAKVYPFKLDPFQSTAIACVVSLFLHLVAISCSVLEYHPEPPRLPPKLLRGQLTRQSPSAVWCTSTYETEACAESTDAIRPQHIHSGMAYGCLSCYACDVFQRALEQQHHHQQCLHCKLLGLPTVVRVREIGRCQYTR